MSHELFEVSAKAVLLNENKDKIVLLYHNVGFSVPGGHLLGWRRLYQRELHALDG